LLGFKTKKWEKLQKIAAAKSENEAKSSNTDDFRFQSIRARKLLARCLAYAQEMPATIMAFETQWLNRQLHEIETIVNAGKQFQSPLTDESKLSLPGNGGKIGPRRFVDTILPKPSAIDNIRQSKTPEHHATDTLCEAGPVVVMKEDQFIFNHRF
jgi:hypothetical protein